MSELYVYSDDENCDTQNEKILTVNNSENYYYGKLMKFSRIKELQFNNLMKNIGSKPAFIDFNKKKDFNKSETSIYGDSNQNIVFNYPETGIPYILEPISDLKKFNHLSESVLKYVVTNSIWAPKSNNSNIAYEWFINPSDWTIIHFNGQILGKITIIESSY